MDQDPNNLACPPSLRFRLNLPTTFQYEGHTYVPQSTILMYPQLTLAPLSHYRPHTMSNLMDYQASRQL